MGLGTLTYRLLQGDALDRLRELPSGGVHCVVTSPPYFGLRDYGIEGQLGLEETPDAYVAKMVEVFREVRRVLRSDGTCWLNIGDSYAGSGKGAWTNKNGGQKEVYVPDPDSPQVQMAKTYHGIKPKDLILIPFRLALALQADGWWVRSDIIWAKPNPMPESVTDRPTRSHEYIFLLTKSKDYYFDSEAFKEPAAQIRKGKSHSRIRNVGGRTDGLTSGEGSAGFNVGSQTRNRRSVWTVTTKPFKGSHFATFPPDLIEPCIKAATSEHGVCSSCGSPFERIVEKLPRPKIEDYAINKNEESGDQRKVGFNARWAAQAWEEIDAWKQASGADSTGGYNGQSTKDHDAHGIQNASDLKRRVLDGMKPKATVGWKQTCVCESVGILRPVVLDPFGGAGTTSLVCERLGRDSIYIDINPAYASMADARLKSGARGLVRCG